MNYAIWMHPEGHVYAYSVDAVMTENGLRRRLFEQQWDDACKMRYPENGTFIEQVFALTTGTSGESLQDWCDEGFREVCAFDNAALRHGLQDTPAEARDLQHRCLFNLVALFDRHRSDSPLSVDLARYQFPFRQPLFDMLSFNAEPERFMPRVLLQPLPQIRLLSPGVVSRSRYDFWEGLCAS